MEKLYEENWDQNMQKETFLRKNFKAVPVPKQGGTGITQQKPIGIGTDTSSTGTPLHNAFGIGTEQSGTDTTTSKMPRLL